MKIYQVDAFTHERFKGNPAAVCVLPEGYVADEGWMQNLASEMNLSETAFLSPRKDGVFGLRWFTPTTEVDLCGHATLATAHIIWQEGLLAKDEVASFDTLSGRLNVKFGGELMSMSFPVVAAVPCELPDGMAEALGCSILGAYKAGQDLLLEVANEETVKGLQPSLKRLASIAIRCFIVTAKGEAVDFVSRVFGPAVGIDEDPVTGSTHCSLTPFWASRFGKMKMTALQLSARGGSINVELEASGKKQRVNISGEAVTIFKGELC